MSKYDELINKYENEIDDLMLLNELKESMINRLFDDEKIKLFIDNAKEIANKLYEEYGDKDINEVIRSKGYKFIEEPEKIYYFSRIDDKKKTISTTSKYDHLEGKVNMITKKKLKQLSVAHEFVHVLELNKMLKIDNHKLLIVSKPLMFGISKKSYTSIIYELIAHQFAKLKTGLKFNPKLLDYIHLVETQKIEYSDLKERLKESKLYYEENIIG